MKAGFHPVQVTHSSQVHLHSRHHQWEELSVPGGTGVKKKKYKAILHNKNYFQACPVVTSVFGKQLDGKQFSLCKEVCWCVCVRVRIRALLFKLHKLSVYYNNHTEGSPQQCAKFGEDRRMHLKINLFRLTMHYGVSFRVETVPCVLCPCAGTSLRWNSVCDSRRA